MATLIQNAANGQRKAMETLFENNKQKVFFIAKSLLGNEKKASDITAQTFKGIFSGLKNEKIVSEDGFTSLAVRRVAENCKKAILKQNPKAYQNSFTVSNPKSIADVNDNYAEFVFNQFNDIQKMVFVLHTAGGLDENVITVVTKLDKKSLEQALNAEKENIERICASSLTYNAICESFIRSEKQTVVPAEVDSAVLKTINDIAAPIAKAKQKKVTTIAIIAIAAALIIGIAAALIIGLNGNGDGDNSDASFTEDEEYSIPDKSKLEIEKVEIDKNLIYYADIDIRNYGTVTVKLDQSQAPITVQNFVSLSKSGFYDGLTFHRIIEGFMAQGGSENGSSAGNGTKDTIFGEFSSNGHSNNLSHTRGAISMARSNAVNSASTQFFIVHEDSLFLDGQYAAFGYVTKGMNIIDDICSDANPTDGNGTILLQDQPIINKITIRTESK